MCKLQNLIKQKFSDAKQLNTQSPDEIVALGCARQCSLITNRKLEKPITNEDLTFNCLSNSIYLKVKKIEHLYPKVISNNLLLNFQIDRKF